jgi:hypothetical protein
MEERGVVLPERLTDRCADAGPSPRSPWQPIETAPTDGTPVLLIGFYPTATGWSDVYHSWAEAPSWRSDWQVHWVRWPHNFRPTHWMPMRTPYPVGGEAVHTGQLRDEQ